jgi:hypothetical protein
MKRLTNILIYVGAFLTLLAQTASGQARAGVGTWGFVNVRYDTQSPASIYTGYGWHAAFAMGGVSHNPRSGYAELVGGVGAVIRTRTSEHWVAFATAGAGAGSFAQIYWLPTVRMRALTSRAQVKWTLGYNGRQAQKLSISPLSVTFPLVRRLSGGVASDISFAEGARTRIATGVELRVRLPGAAVGVDALRDVKGDGSRLRVFFASLF